MTKFLFIFFIIFQNAYCQNFSSEKRNNNVNTEIGGHSESIISINYERLFTNDTNNFIFLASIGIGRNPGADEENAIKFPASTSLPIIGGILYGKKNHFAQIKIGYTPVFSKDFVNTSLNPNTFYQKFQSDFPLSIGYRYMTNDGLVAQGFPIFIWSNNPNEKFKVSFGLSVGYVF